MSQGLEVPVEQFANRRDYTTQEQLPICERRQFSSTHDNLSPDAQELARAIDQYKVHHRRRFITYEEMITVVKSLGYRR
ncbi:MAG: hypothetical protein V3R99_07225 [Thermoguttaceae bacterium]